jgi:hypothetical protein
MKKILPPPQPPKTKKKKKSRHLECMLQPTHWLLVFLVSKNCWSPFLAWANGRGRDWTRKKLIWGHSMSIVNIVRI